MNEMEKKIIDESNEFIDDLQDFILYNDIGYLPSAICCVIVAVDFYKMFGWENEEIKRFICEYIDDY